MNDAAARRRGIFAFVVTTLVWGSTWLVIKGQLGSVPVAWSVTWRFALACAAMFLLAAARRERLALSPRALMFAALATGDSVLRGVLPSADVICTADVDFEAPRVRKYLAALGTAIVTDIELLRLLQTAG